MTINTQNSFLISSLLHLLFISVFIAIPKPDYSIVKQVIDISFLFSSIENETQPNKKQEEKPIIKSKAYQMKTENAIEPKTIQDIKESTHEKILSEPEKKKDINQQEQMVHSPMAERVETPGYQASELSASQTADITSLPYLRSSDSYASSVRVKSDAYEKISVFKDIAATTNAGVDVDKSAIISSFINKVESIKHYPYIARRKGIEGTVLVSVHLNKDGELINLSLKKSSGYDILDISAMELLKKVIPFKHGYPKDLKIEIPITYKLTR